MLMMMMSETLLKFLWPESNFLEVGNILIVLYIDFSIMDAQLILVETLKNVKFNN